MSLKGSEQRPLIFEIEDLHWSDQTSEAYLAALVESLAGAPILLLTTYRPGYRPLWMDKSYATPISLPSLTLQQGTAVVQSTGHRSELPAQVVHHLVGGSLSVLWGGHASPRSGAPGVRPEQGH